MPHRARICHKPNLLAPFLFLLGLSVSGWPGTALAAQSTGSAAASTPTGSSPNATGQSVQQQPASTEQKTADDKDKDSDKAKDEKAKADEEKKKKHLLPGSVFVAPLPISSPAIGTGITPIGGYIFPISEKDKKSPPSVIGAAGLITDNDSRGYGVGAQLYFGENTYKATAAYLDGNVNYSLYGVGDQSGNGPKLPLTQDGHAFFGEFLRRLFWQFFVGPRFMTGRSVVSLNVAETMLPVPPDLDLHTTLRAIGFRIQRDTSVNRFYPTQGTFTDFTLDFFAQDLGSKYTFQAYRFTFAKYSSLSKNQVLAFGSYVCGTGGRPPFYGNCIYGAQNWLRGYTAGRYLDRYMLASQLEYRLTLPWRLGLVAFGGLGGVIPGGSDQVFRNGYFLPAGGGGLRFELSKKYHLNLRADIAQGKDGHSFGMGVSEAF
jgi:Omp85 superfamily domain